MPNLRNHNSPPSFSITNLNGYLYSKVSRIDEDISTHSRRDNKSTLPNLYAKLISSEESFAQAIEKKKNMHLSIGIALSILAIACIWFTSFSSTEDLFNAAQPLLLKAALDLFIFSAPVVGIAFIFAALMHFASAFSISRFKYEATQPASTVVDLKNLKTYLEENKKLHEHLSKINLKDRIIAAHIAYILHLERRLEIEDKKNKKEFDRESSRMIEQDILSSLTVSIKQ